MYRENIPVSPVTLVTGKGKIIIIIIIIGA